MVTLESLGYRYGRKGKSLFEDLSLRLEPGKIYGLLGRNGAGKSTLLKLMSGLLFPRQGQARFEGSQIGERRPAILSEIFFLPETFSLPPLDGAAYCKAVAPFYPRFDQAAFERGLDEFMVERGVLLNRMSYGQQKKFMIAFGLACQCRLVLLDEPTNGLDIPAKSQFRRLVASSCREDGCMVISTHQARDLEGLIDPIVIIEAGQVVFNHERWTIDSRLVQSIRREAAGAGVLHAEQALGNWVALEARAEPLAEPSEGGIDLELLFNAVMANPAGVNQALEVRR